MSHDARRGTAAMFKKILIANRGEIACRIIKTARRLGIATVAVYSDADGGARHVDMADEAVHLGAPAATASYLAIEKIVDACRQTGAEAVHPGYGFLSEREAFATALADAGLVFIGPNPGAIAAMGDKITSKKMAAQAGVSTVPGFLGEIDTPGDAVAIADDIGYPVIIKASAALTLRKGSLLPGQKPARVLAMTAFLSKSSLSIRDTSKFKCWAINTVTLFIWASANARCSGAIKKLSKKRHRRCWMQIRACVWEPRPSPWPGL